MKILPSIKLLGQCTCLVLGFILLIQQPTGAGDETKKWDARIIRESITCEISDNGKIKETGYARLKIYNEDGKEHGRLFFFETKFERLKDFSGKVFDATGRLVYSIGKKDGEKYCGWSGYALYSDICTWMYTLSCSSFPYTIQYEYETEYKSLMWWPVWMPMSTVPVDKSIYELRVPQSCRFETKTVGEIQLPQITDDGKTRLYRWEQHDIPGFPDEEYTYEAPHDRLSVWFAPHEFKLGKYKLDGSSWNTLAATSSAMYRDRFHLKKTQLAFADEVYANASSPENKYRQLHDALVERSRYVAIEIGIGGWEPSPAAETFTRGYGDCKDLSTMYVAMLRQAGIKARPAILMTRHRGWTDPEFPLCRFNHVIFFADIEGDTVWTDPTCQPCAVGDLLWYDENIAVLAVDPQIGGIVHTPRSTPEENSVVRSAEVELTQGSSVAFYLSLTANGNTSHRLQWQLAETEKKEIDNLLKNSTYGLPERFTPDAMSIVANKLSRSQVALRLSGVVRNVSQSVGKKNYLDIDLLGLFTKAESVDLTKRELGIELQYPRSFIDTLTIRIPPGWQPVEIPEDIVLEDEFGLLAITNTVTENAYIIVREKQSFPYRIHPDQLAAFAEHIAAFKDAIPQYLVLEKE